MQDAQGHQQTHSTHKKRDYKTEKKRILHQQRKAQ